MDFTLQIFFLGLTVYTILAKASPTPQPQNPLHGPQAGQIINPTRLVLKLPCSECPPVDEASHDIPSSFIYDLTITPHYPPTIIWTPPTNPFNSPFPPNAELPFFPPPALSHPQSHPLLLVPTPFSLAAYIAGAAPWSNYSMHAGTMTSTLMRTTSPWNVTRVSFVPAAFEAVPVAVVYLLNSRVDVGGREGRMRMQFVWWEVVPAREWVEAGEGKGRGVPGGLVEKLEGLARERDERQVAWAG